MVLNASAPSPAEAVSYPFACNLRSITDTTSDESPSFAPNSKLLVYATVQQGREALMTSTLDGRIKARLAGQAGDIREPDWGPFMKS